MAGRKPVWEWFLAAGILLALTVWYFQRLLTGEVMFGDADTLTQTYPWRTFGVHWLSQGIIPLWNPHTFGGIPFLALPLTALYFPTYWLSFGGELFYRHSVEVALYHALAALGVLFLLKQWGLPAAAALLGGFLFSFNLRARAEIPWVTVGPSYVLLPWFILASEAMFRKGKLRREGLGLALCTWGSILAGYPLGTYYNLLFGLGFGALTWGEELVATWKKLPQNLGRLLAHVTRPWTLWGLSAGFGMLLGMFHLLPLAEFKGFTRYASVTYEEAINGALTLANVPGLFTAKPLTEGASYFGNLFPFFLGGALLSLRHPNLRKSLLLGLIALGLSLGNEVPLYKIGYHLLPGFSSLRVPTRVLYLFSFWVAIMAAYAVAPLARLGKRPGRGLTWAVSLIVITLTVGQMRPYLKEWEHGSWLPVEALNKPPEWSRFLGADPQGRVSFFIPKDHLKYFDDTIRRSGVFWDLLPLNTSAIFGLDDIQGYSPFKIESLHTYFEGSTRYPLGRTTPHTAEILFPQSRLADAAGIRYFLTFTGFDYQVARMEVAEGVTVTRQEPLDLDLQVPKPQPVNEITVFSSLGNAVFVPQGQEVARLRLFNAQGLVEEFPLVAGVNTSEWSIDHPAISSIAAHRRAKVATSFPARTDGKSFEGRSFRAVFHPRDCSAITALQVIYTGLEGHMTLLKIAFKFEELVPYFSDSEERLVYEGFHTRLFWNRRALDRAAWYPESRVHRAGSPETAEAYLNRFDSPPESVIVEAPKVPPQQAKGERGQVTVLPKCSPHLMEVQVEAPADGVLFLPEAFYAGWKAEVNGREVPIYRANTMFRGVEVPAGIHVVALQFEPQSFRLGLYFSGLALFYLLVVIVRNR